MPDETLSGSQLEKLGDRLRDGPLSLADLQQLRQFLETLEPFAEDVFAKIRGLDVKAAGLRPGQIMRRNVKTVRSILAKLRRQTTKLVQIQDLVGCRVVVQDIIDQDEWLSALRALFPQAQVVDRRAQPQHGYRAVHVIVRNGIQRFEVQLRTFLQDGWANIVERTADRLGLLIKYGGGDPSIQRLLLKLSGDITSREAFEDSWQARLEQRTPTASPSAVRLGAWPSANPKPLAKPGAPQFAIERGGVVLYSSHPISMGSALLIGKEEAVIERASVGEEFAVPESVQEWITFNYMYPVIFERGSRVIERFYDTWEESYDLDEEISTTMTYLEQLLK